MRMLDRFRKRKAGSQPVITPADKVTKIAQDMPLENRCADFKERGIQYRMHVKDTGAGGHGGQMTRTFTSDEIDPATVVSMIGEEFGGGSYEIHFTIGDRVLMLENDPTKREVYHVRIAGPPKRARVAQGTKDKLPKAEITSLTAIMADKDHPLAPLFALVADLLRQAITGGSNTSPQAGFDQVVESLTKAKALLGDQDTQHPLDYLASAIGVLKQVQTMGAPGLGNPISATGALTGAGGGFKAGAGQFLGNFAGAYQNTTGVNVMDAIGTLGSRLSGQPGKALPQSAQAGAQVPAGGFAVPGLGRIDPAAWIISQADKRADTDEIARNAIYILDVMSNVGGINSQASEYAHMWIADPGGSFKRHIGDKPEFQQIQNADPEYVSKLRASLYQIGQAYAAEYMRQAAARQQPQPEAGQETQQDQTPEQPETWEGGEDASTEQAEQAAQAQPEAQPGAEPEQSESDSQPGTVEGHDDPDPIRQDC